MEPVAGGDGEDGGDDGEVVNGVAGAALTKGHGSGAGDVASIRLLDAEEDAVADAAGLGRHGAREPDLGGPNGDREARGVARIPEAVGVVGGGLPGQVEPVCLVKRGKAAFGGDAAPVSTIIVLVASANANSLLG